MPVSSLGIGSGVLTADVLDQLRAADDNVILKPIESKLEVANQKEEANKLLSGFMTTFKSSTASLGGESLYLARSVSGSNDNVTATALDGADMQSFNITNINKAENDVWNSKTFSSKTALMNAGSGSIALGVGDSNFSIDYTSSSTLDDIRQAINDEAGSKITASILKIGTDQYQLVVNAKNTNEAVTFTDSNLPAKQLDTITLTGDAVAGDTFSWSDGTNTLGAINLVDGETVKESGVRIADAINSDVTLKALYVATATDTGFTIQSKTDGLSFSGTSTSTGTQASSEILTTTAKLPVQLDTITLTGDAVAGDTFAWSDGTNTLPTVNLVDGETVAQSGVRIADAINADVTLNALYIATATDTGFTIEAKTAGTSFSGTSTSTGTQASSESLTTKTNTAAKQLDTVILSGNAVAGDTFTWSDGTNTLPIVSLVDGETIKESGVRIAAAINADSTLSALYTATATADGFTIESKEYGTSFTGSSTSTGTQTSLEALSNTAAADSSFVAQLGLNRIQTAKEATFDFNGISITRSSNDISDLVNGVTITLNSNQTSSDTASIKIGQNDTAIKTEMELLITNYNLLSSNLVDMTLYDQDKAVAGIFNGDSSIKGISRALSRVLSQTDAKGNSLFDYGIEIDRKGVMSLDSSKFSSKLAEDPTALELLFRGDSSVDGIFKNLDDKMSSYTSSSGILSSFTESLSTSKTNLISEYDKQKTSLDIRYATMTKRFTAYDAMISKLNSQFSSLQMMIDAQSNNNN